MALLRAYQPEARDLVKAALDILVPALPRRLPPAELVKAIKWTKKIMSEEGHAVPTLLHIFQLLVTLLPLGVELFNGGPVLGPPSCRVPTNQVRHPALFYAYRQQFLSQMLQFFNRLGRFPNRRGGFKRRAPCISRRAAGCSGGPSVDQNRPSLLALT